MVSILSVGLCLKLFGAKRAMLLAVYQASEKQVNLQEIVPLTRFKDIVDNTFTGDLKMPYLMMVIRRPSQNPESLCETV